VKDCPTGITYTKTGRHRILKLVFSLEVTQEIDRYRGDLSPREFVEIAIQHEIEICSPLQ